ncbi:NADP-dependent alcohol dehydrogenase [Talaromyces stipitatus ATCC 10500]|uniref:NADP-dependent alcohol dehydrogenase n=1 Tax=Talaromyces stipitatus (strain ATCC 10500 / CBS 375.48 / QM 6759 / NRRL 1006) TaxID=441959 RepID=B8M7L5_TALSN|nr:NADP-dependent alcohol dehydrogenase [Talaromyces stipitatus ATCC 10500]XP_002480002.1 NADP-dependent alcohol dehydrogenase [Talaromyces stipitatus ATCC 10500]XP_002480003.1 NADP-dependent alcohol dehydrogenase [Talaromyces stipitatus ATCC 10500]XP_002480004.1 NADP-dependent alcohol dehydrogenase [Talaromyces stipitatus ATCC 10500]XP_002480005.1 NADP-dependent alcohol dehydrogenase [Talaromyces stipitatus ATCC 10500]EED19567.1 NADP-dependent alcohol dehydrogenase [Talaromyces stipitatus ATC
MPSFTVYKGNKEGFPKKSNTVTPDALVGDQVYLKVTASGVCGTDLHYRHVDMVLGHEGVGVVEEVGPQVKYLKKGDRVGWGYETDSCGHCQECLQGTEIFCPERALYGMTNFDQGSFAHNAVMREAFVFKIPDNISDENAAPLQCGGATVYTALSDLKPNETVGVLGVGGLGHLAIQFAAKMGARVVVLSGSDRKKEEAIKLGAHYFFAFKGQHQIDLKSAPKITRLLVTSAVQPNWNTLMPIMANNSRIYPLTYSTDNLPIPAAALNLYGISVVGCLVANRAVQRAMLEFASFHNITPVIEKFPMTEDGIKDALVKLENGDVHFRSVLIPH